MSNPGPKDEKEISESAAADEEVLLGTIVEEFTGGEDGGITSNTVSSSSSKPIALQATIKTSNKQDPLSQKENKSQDAQPPPRPPSAPTASGTTRSASSEDSPFDESSPPPPSNVHRRNVSWGSNNVTHEPAPNSSSAPHSPERNDEHHSPLDPLQHAAAARTNLGIAAQQPSLPSLESTTSQPPPIPKKNMVVLEDVIKANPLESEAETLILSVLEQQENLDRARARADTTSGTSSNILSNIPDTSSNVFGGKEEELDEAEELESITEIEASVMTEHVGDGDAASVTSAHTMTSIKNAPGHRRVRTMEEQLYGLSKALSYMQPAPKSQQQQQQPTAAAAAAAVGSERSNTGAGKDTRTNNPSLPSTTLPPKATPQKDGAAMAFAHGATVLQQRKKKPDAADLESGMSGPAAAAAAAAASERGDGTAEPRWGLNNKATILAPTPAVVVETGGGGHDNKKNDDILVEDVSDLEVGAGGGGGSQQQLNVEAGLETTTTTTPAEQQQLQDGATTSSSGRPPASLHQSKWRKTLGTKQVRQTKGLASDFHTFSKQRGNALRTHIRILLLIIVPATCVAAILFYLADNPPTGKNADTSSSSTPAAANSTAVMAQTASSQDENNKASASWWVLFICVRQILVFSLARLMQVVIIDFFCLSSRIAVNMFGQLITLFIVQSKGWPFLITCWAILCYALLSGGTDFAQHWLFWQDEIGLFSKENPSGTATSEEWYLRVLAIAVSVGLIVSAKRLWLGFYLGKKTFVNYAEDLTRVMKKIVLLSKVGIMARWLSQEAFLANQLKREPKTMRNLGITREKFEGLIRNTMDDDGKDVDVDTDERESRGKDVRSLGDSGFIVEPGEPNRRDGLTLEQKMRVDELLGRWEEPLKEYGPATNVSISAILQFRASLASLESPYMFSIAWGDVRTRERMILCTQRVFKRINLRTPETSTVRFDILARAALDEKGVMDLEMLEDLIRLLRPDRDGSLSLLDFAKSVDAVYKEAKLLRGAIHNSEKIDLAFESVINVVFYVIMTTVILNQLGFDPLALFLSLSSIIVAFAFMVGSASSKMFEGWLFILLRRPYDIGDRIHVSSVNSDTSPSGSPGWIVKDVTLFTTTVVFGSTNERATLSNGSMASSRIINMTRSPQAVLYVFLKFSTSVSYEKIQILEQAVRKFVIARPREWANFIAFRPTSICADLGYVEYILILQHRESWANIGALKASQSEVASFCHELSKKMDMRYKSPPMPVHLAFMNQMNGMLGPTSESTSLTKNQLQQPTSGPVRPNLQTTSTGPATSEFMDISSVVDLFEKGRKSKES